MDGTQLSPGETAPSDVFGGHHPVVLEVGRRSSDVGRTHRLAPPPLRLAVAYGMVVARSRAARSPSGTATCTTIVPWQEGGPTNLANVVALCRTHHGLIEPAPPLRLPDGTLERVDQWQVRIDGRGLPEFLPPVAADAARRRSGRPCATYRSSSTPAEKQFASVSLAGDPKPSHDDAAREILAALDHVVTGGTGSAAAER